MWYQARHQKAFTKKKLIFEPPCFRFVYLQVRFKRGYKSILKEHLEDKNILELWTSIDEDANRLYRPPHFETYAARVCIKDSRVTMRSMEFQKFSILHNPSMNMRLLQVCFKSIISRVPNPGKIRYVSTISIHFSCFQQPQVRASSLVSLILISPALLSALWQVSLLWLSAWGNWSSVVPDIRLEMLGHFFPYQATTWGHQRSVVTFTSLPANNVRFQVEREFLPFWSQNLLASFWYHPYHEPKSSESETFDGWTLRTHRTLQVEIKESGAAREGTLRIISTATWNIRSSCAAEYLQAFNFLGLQGCYRNKFKKDFMQSSCS